MAVNKITSSQRKDSKIRTITSFALVALIIPTTLFGGYFFVALIIFLCFFATKEILEVPGKTKYTLPTKLVVYAFVFSFIFWTIIKSSIINKEIFSRASVALSEMSVSLLAIISYFFVLFFISIVDKRVQLSDVTLLFTMGLILALGFQSMLYLRLFPNSAGLKYYSDTIVNVDFTTDGTTTYGTYFRDYYSRYANNYQDLASSVLLGFTFIGVWLSDVGAYFTGMLFGKHRMNPRISPHKTWEGFFGGIFFSLIFSLSAAAIMEFCFNLPLIPGLVQFRHSPLLVSMRLLNGHSWFNVLLLALIMPTIGALGGLAFSLVKRTYGIKDFGKIFPGHGGVIDRFDSVLFSSIAMSLVIQFMSTGWSFLG